MKCGSNMDIYSLTDVPIDVRVGPYHAALLPLGLVRARGGR